MTREEVMKIAIEWARVNETNWPFDLIRYAGMEDGDHFVHLDHKVKPRYTGWGVGLQISEDGKVQEVENCIAINNIAINARELEQSENTLKN